MINAIVYVTGNVKKNNIITTKIQWKLNLWVESKSPPAQVQLSPLE